MISKKPLFLFVFTFFVSFGLTSCDFFRNNEQVSGNQSGTSQNDGNESKDNNDSQEKVVLQVPKNIYCDNNVVYWDEVKEAEYYLLEIKTGGNDIDNYNCSLNSFNLSAIGWTESVEFNYRVKAIADENSNYVDSKWSVSLSGEYNYSKTEFGEKFNAYHLSKGLGCSVNLIDENSSYTSFLTGTSIFDFQKLANITVMKYGINHGDVKISSQKDFDSAIDEHNTEINLKANVDLIKNTKTKIVSQKKMGLSLEYNGNYSRRSEEETSLYNYTLKNYWQDNEICFNDYRNSKEDFKLALSDKFLNYASRTQEMLNNTENDKSVLASFVNSYGTHVITSAILGGCLDLEYTIIGEKKAVQAKSSTDIGGELFVSKNYVETNIDANVKIDSSKYQTSQDINQNLRIQFTGGDNQGLFFTENNISDFLPAYSAWAKSTNDSNSQQIIDVSNGSLYCIWDLLDDSNFSVLKTKLDEYFESVACQNYDTVKAKLNSFYDEDYISDGDGTEAAPYIIRTSNDLKKLSTHNDINKHFKIINDIDLSNCDANELLPSTFYGVLDGNNHKLLNYNPSYTSTSDYISSDDNSYLGLFIQNKGTIKNLSIENNTSSSISIKTNCSKKHNYYGALVGLNEGVISNCRSFRIGIKSNNLYDVGDQNSYEWYVSSLCGLNKGTIEYCVSEYSSIYSKVDISSAGGYAYVVTGFICAEHSLGSITNCFAYECSSESYSNGGRAWIGGGFKGSSYVGLIGVSKNENLLNLASYNLSMGKNNQSGNVWQGGGDDYRGYIVGKYIASNNPDDIFIPSNTKAFGNKNYAPTNYFNTLQELVTFKQLSNAGWILDSNGKIDFTV